MCCGVIPILFGWCLRVPSLHALVFIQKTFFVTCSCCFVFLIVKRREVGKEGEGNAWSVKYQSIELWYSQTKNHHKFKCFQVKFIYGV